MALSLSVIILTRNSELTISRCLESLGFQDYLNFEIIIQDCCSTDNTINLVLKFQTIFPKLNFRIQQFRDSGIYDAMNIALKRALGNWVYFLGSDDWLYSHNVFSTILNAEDNHFDVIYGDVLSNHLGGRYAGRFTTDKIFDQNICHQALFLRRSLFSAYGFFNTNYKIAADWEHNLRWFLDPSVRVTYTNMIVACFSDYGVSSSSCDYLFERNKTFLYIRYGRHSLQPFLKLSLLIKSLYYILRRRQFRILLPTLVAFRYVLYPVRTIIR